MRSIVLVLAASVPACGSSSPAPTTMVTAPAASPAPSSAPVADGPVTLTFQMFVEEGATRRAFSAGQTLRSGDRMSLTLTVDRPAFAYVLQFFPDGSSAVLFPREGEANRITGTMRVPPSGAFELDDVVGEETLYVVASTRPLAQVDASVMAAVDQVRTTNAPGSASASAPAPAPVPSTAPVPSPIASPAPSPTASQPATGTVASRPPGKPGGAGAPISKPRPAATPAPGRASLTTRGLVRTGEATKVTAQSDAEGLAVFHVSFQHAPR